MARQFATLTTHPGHGQALPDRQTVDGVLGIEDGVDPPYRFRRDRCRQL
jgi:hypothetical protein